MSKDVKKEALAYHAEPVPGKISVELTKPAETQRDLALAYSPGVAEPCREIAADPAMVYRYTGKGNLVAVISNGTATWVGQPRGIGEQASHGRQGAAVQALCGH
jgi:malate dehydrogenase (oxaloacetate-decarboxylating)(NADP+)